MLAQRAGRQRLALRDEECDQPLFAALPARDDDRVAHARMGQ
jgi:hypothetical protein